ncbi:hypothetical protein KBD20_01115 [Candidatus Saccharibacteria bacterium]|nr:hypothetical protein [Candidatus Saccharibacteria bacterium]
MSDSTKQAKQVIPEVRDPKLALAALEYLYATHFISKRRLYYENFMRGLFFSLGSLLGFALVVTVVLWGLSLFDSYPFVKQISDTIESSVSK